MKSLLLIFLVGFTTFAQEKYEAPAVPQMKWEKPKVNYYQDEKWNQGEALSDSSPEAAPSEDLNNPERKPSSGGEEDKPKFWDFKIVK